VRVPARAFYAGARAGGERTFPEQAPGQKARAGTRTQKHLTCIALGDQANGFT
jgi:hypothetical protein